MKYCYMQFCNYGGNLAVMGKMLNRSIRRVVASVIQYVILFTETFECSFIQLLVVTRHFRFGIKVGQIGPKWEKSRTFSD